MSLLYNISACLCVHVIIVVIFLFCVMSGCNKREHCNKCKYSKDEKVVWVKNVGFDCSGHGDHPINLVVIKRSPEVAKEVGEYRIVCEVCARFCAKCDEPCLDFYCGETSMEDEDEICYFCCFPSKQSIKK